MFVRPGKRRSGRDLACGAHHEPDNDVQALVIRFRHGYQRGRGKTEQMGEIGNPPPFSPVPAAARDRAVSTRPAAIDAAIERFERA